LVVQFWNEGSGWFFSCNLIGSISSHVIGWFYKTFQSSFEFENKEEEAAMTLI
jgi:biotin transporter BioY